MPDPELDAATDAAEAYFYDVLGGNVKSGHEEKRRAYAMWLAWFRGDVPYDKVVETASNIEGFLKDGKVPGKNTQESVVELSKWKLNESSRALEPAPL